MNTLRAFLRLPPAARRVAVEATLALLFARWLVAHVKMHRWRRLLDIGPQATPPANLPQAVVGGRRERGDDAEKPDCDVPRTVGAVVRKVARRRPFRARCLPRAMAAQWLLRRRGIPSRLTFGVRRGGPPETLEFHAWLTVAGEPVIGGAGAETCTPLPPPGRDAPACPEPAAFGAPARRVRGGYAVAPRFRIPK